jgi:mono/diheme cytochrome c family protein
MLLDKTRKSVNYTSAILTALVTGLMLFPISTLRANAAQDSAATAATFRTKCAMCHGQDGSGSEVGKTMNVPDLRSPEVQKLQDAALVQVISDGKGGMPSFKNSLTAEQIQALVKHIRTLAARK